MDDEDSSQRQSSVVSTLTKVKLIFENQYRVIISHLLMIKMKVMTQIQQNWSLKMKIERTI